MLRKENRKMAVSNLGFLDVAMFSRQWEGFLCWGAQWQQVWLSMCFGAPNGCSTADNL